MTDSPTLVTTGTSGLQASTGNSTGPHLHFEVGDPAATPETAPLDEAAPAPDTVPVDALRALLDRWERVAGRQRAGDRYADAVIASIADLREVINAHAEPDAKPV